MSYWVGCGAGFAHDRTDAALPVVTTLRARAEPAALVYATLAEDDLARGHLARARDPHTGFDPMLAAWLEPVLRPCIEARVVVVGNFGWANPRAAGRCIRELAQKQGLGPLRIAVVEGQDVRPLLAAGALQPLPAGVAVDLAAALPIHGADIALGAAPIAAAIRAGAQVVVTGHVAAPALTLGALLAHHDWTEDDRDRLAAGVLAGHLVAGGGRVTGGDFADPGSKDVPGLSQLGLPIAEVSADGSVLLTKAEPSGGSVDLRTVKERLLEGVDDPSAYVTPDVVLDLTRIRLTQVGPNRVRLTGARGRPAPPTLQVTLACGGDWLGEAEISYAGPNARARGELAAAVVERRLAKLAPDLRRRFDLIGTVAAFDGDDGTLRRRLTSEPDEVRLRLAAASPDRHLVEHALREVAALAGNGPAGGGGVRTHIEHHPRTVTGALPQDHIEARVTFVEEPGT